MSEIPFPGKALALFKVGVAAHDCTAEEYPFVVWVDRSSVDLCPNGNASYVIVLDDDEELELPTGGDVADARVCLCMGDFIG